MSMNELAKEFYLKQFKDHKATLTDYGNIKILDFKKPDSNEGRIRFLFEEDYCRLHITGDYGDLIACNYYNMTYDKFPGFLHDVGYFEEKISCHSRDLYVYDEEQVAKDLRKELESIGIIDVIDENVPYEDFENILSDVMEDFSGDYGVNGRGLANLLEIDEDAYFYAHELGRKRTMILDIYFLAFELAQKQLDNSKEM